MFCDYDYLMMSVKLFAIFCAVFFSAYFLYRLIRHLIIRLYVYQSMGVEVRNDISRIKEIMENISVPGKLPDNYNALAVNVILSKDGFRQVKASIGLFELAAALHKEPVNDTAQITEAIYLLEQFKDKATTQKSHFYNTKQAQLISASYILISKHILLSRLVL